MEIVTREDFSVPSKCSICKFSRNYDCGAFARNPHWCCELMWILKEEDYKVNPETVDANCPLKCLNV